jgi:hypothetical protein
LNLRIVPRGDEPYIDDQADGTRRFFLPPGPRCEVCAHVMCPLCQTWCDTLIGAHEPDNEPDAASVDPRSCCGGECNVSDESIAAWEAQWPPCAFEKPPGLWPVYEVLEGPFWPGERG